MRDLHAVGPERPPFEATLELSEETERASAPAPDLERQYRAVRREQTIAGVAVMLLDAAKMVEPVIELLCDRALRWAALGSTVGLAFYALRSPSWERLAIVATVGVLAPWIIRRGKF